MKRIVSLISVFYIMLCTVQTTVFGAEYDYEVIPFEFDYMRRCNHDELFVAGMNKYSTDSNADTVVSGTNYGLIDRSENVVLPIEYEDIENLEEHGSFEELDD